MSLKNIILISSVFIYCSNGQDPPHIFYAIDKHADEAPAYLKHSIPALVSYLVQPAKTNVEKVRAIYRWISQNIAYDADSYFERRLISDEPHDVIQSGYAVCGGYARLFKRMCLEIALPVEIITGWSKGYTERLPAEANHAWNAIRIHDQWYLLDVTWGAGYINEQQTYSKSFQEHYFFTDPQLMIYDHFPEEEKWQLLDNPVSRSQFEELILLRPHFFKTGLELISHNESNIDVSEELVIQLSAPPATRVNAELIQQGRVLADHYVLTQKLEDNCFINVHFPDEGDYTLRVYSKTDGSEKLYHWACDYKIHVLKNLNSTPFAKQFASFDNLNGFIYYPLDMFLSSAGNQPFKIKIDYALEVALLINEQTVVPLQKDKNIYTGTVTPQKGMLRIMAKTDTTSQYQFLLEYQVK